MVVFSPHLREANCFRPAGGEITISATSLLPTAIVVVVAIGTRRPLHALFAGVLTGHLMLAGADFFGSFTDGALATMQEEITGWITITAGMFGSLVALLMRGGAVSAFSTSMGPKMKNRAYAVVMTWLMGIVIFIDDYLNAMMVGSSVKSLTDRFKVSREMLAYVVDSTAAPICILIPITSWALVVMGLLETNNAAPAGGGFIAYLEAIPYMFYAWATVLMVPLVGMRAIPLIGPMRSFELRTERGEERSSEPGIELGEHSGDGGRLHNFLVPIGALVLSFWLFSDGLEVDILQSMVATVLFTAVFYVAQGVMKWNEAVAAIKDGFIFMIPLLVLIAVTFMLRDINEQLQLAEYVIQTVTPIMTPQWMPAVVFLALSLVTFTAATFWGVIAISLPIVVPLAMAMEVPLPVVIGAVVSAGAFGSHACFYADATILSARASGCDPMDHAFSQFPYALIAALIATACFFAFA